MTRFPAWVMAVYVVVNAQSPGWYVVIRDTPTIVEGIATSDEVQADDLAESLNQAHERRTTKGLTCDQRLDALEDQEFIRRGQETLKKIQHMRGCGLDDCGKEPHD